MATAAKKARTAAVIEEVRAITPATPNLDRVADEGAGLGADRSRRIGAQIAVSQ